MIFKRDTLRGVCRTMIFLAALQAPGFSAARAGVSVVPTEPFSDEGGFAPPRSIPTSRLDLVVSKVEVIRVLRLFGESRLKVRPHVKNIGEEDVVGPVKLQVVYWGRYYCTIEGGIRSGKESTTEGTCAAFRESRNPALPPAAVRFQVDVDPENRIPENNESNNQCQVSITFGLEKYFVRNCGYAEEKKAVPVF